MPSTDSVLHSQVRPRLDLALRLALLAIATLVVLAGAMSGARTTHAAAGVPVTYKAGWNLVGGPDGTNLQGVGRLYTLGPGGGYATSAGTDPVAGGTGYWAFYATDTTVTLNGAGLATSTVAAPAGQYVMLGNPSGTQAVRVSGADSVFSYDAAAGSYREGTTLNVGQGAWALAASGGTITLTAFGPAQAIPVATTAPTASPPPAASAAPVPDSNAPVSNAPALAVSVYVDPTQTTATNTSAGVLVLGVTVLKNGRPATGDTQLLIGIDFYYTTPGMGYDITARGTLHGSSGLLDPIRLRPLRNIPIFIHAEATLDGVKAVSDLTYISPR